MIFPLFGFGQQGRSATISSQTHLNLRAEIAQDAEKSRLVFYGRPGLELRTSFGDTPLRGWIAVGDLYYVVHRGTFYEVNNAGTKTSRGTLSTTTGRVDMSYDGAVIVITTGTNGYTYTVATTTLAEISDAQYPDSAKTCTWIGGYFIVDDGATDIFQYSPDGTNWDALDFATAESNPDGLVRVFADNGELVLLGVKTTEFWSLAGGGDDAFVPIKGATQEFGLAARWSLTQYNSGLAGVFKNPQGQVQVMYIAGYVPKPISSQELDEIINGYATVSDATAFATMESGHPILQVNFPTPEKSWQYDMSSNLWSPVEYGLGGGRHRGEMSLDYLNKTLISDYSTGDIYDLAPDTYTDNGEAIAREIVGKHFFKNNDRVTVDELYVDFETGVGLVSGQGDDPQAMLQVSKDNGHTWGNERWTTIGAIGTYLTRVVWRRLGRARDWTFRIRCSDPIKFVITFAAIKARQ